MKSRSQIEKFLDQASYCSTCDEFKSSLKERYDISLDAANEFIYKYDGWQCHAITAFMYSTFPLIVAAKYECINGNSAVLNKMVGVLDTVDLREDIVHLSIGSNLQWTGNVSMFENQWKLIDS